MSRRIFLNGNVFDGLNHHAGLAVATGGDRIVAVGDLDEVRSVAGSGTEEVDLAGGLVAPGFQDAHNHPMVGGLEQARDRRVLRRGDVPGRRACLRWVSVYQGMPGIALFPWPTCHGKHEISCIPW